jgi:hypothetical protein
MVKPASPILQHTPVLSCLITNSVYLFLRYGAKQIRCACLVRLLSVLILGPLVIPLELSFTCNHTGSGDRESIPVFPISPPSKESPLQKAMPDGERLYIMRKRYFREEDVLRFIWEAADEDGMWEGDDQTLAAAFGVTENEVYASLGDLCDRNRLQRIGDATYIITAWRERDDAEEDESKR